MRLGMVGLGKMGSNVVERLIASGHEHIVFDNSLQAVNEPTNERGVAGSFSLRDLLKQALQTSCDPADDSGGSQK